MRLHFRIFSRRICPYQLVIHGQSSELSKFLKQGENLANEHEETSETLLRTAIRTSQPKMVLLLLDHGANPNQEMGITREDSVIGFEFLYRVEPQKTPPLSLFKLLLTYGGDHNKTWNLNYAGQPILQSDTGRLLLKIKAWMDELLPECHAIHNTYQNAQAYFEQGDYNYAKDVFKEAAYLLEQFANKEEGGKDRYFLDGYTPESIYTKSYAKRAAKCHALAEECDERLRQKQSRTSSRTPLLGHRKID
jgi:hypothetical protein